MELFGLSLPEMAVIVVVAILLFGARLPQVAGEAAAMLQKVRRALSDLRRESGIDQEIYRARRDFEDGVRTPMRNLDVQGAVRRETEQVRRDLTPPSATAAAPTNVATPSPAPSVEPPKPPAAADPSGPDRG